MDNEMLIDYTFLQDKLGESMLLDAKFGEISRLVISKRLLQKKHEGRHHAPHVKGSNMREFEFKKIDFEDKEYMEKLYRLRFEVYCYECGFLKEEDYPDGLEFDEHDEQSVHFAALDKDDGEVIGTLRMILPGIHPLPIEHYCPQINVNSGELLEAKYGEISRLVISKQLRRRKDDGLYYGPQLADDKKVVVDNKEFLRRAKPMAFGLYRELYRECKKIDVTHWYTLMEKGLWRLLDKQGLSFECIGEEINYRGPVNPYLAVIENMEKEVCKNFPKFYDYFCDGVEI
jgi:N-acyl amino acid synthase of PEP-CTERM/exosortase system